MEAGEWIAVVGLWVQVLLFAFGIFLYHRQRHWDAKLEAAKELAVAAHMMNITVIDVLNLYRRSNCRPALLQTEDTLTRMRRDAHRAVLEAQTRFLLAASQAECMFGGQVSRTIHEYNWQYGEILGRIEPLGDAAMDDSVLLFASDVGNSRLLLKNCTDKFEAHLKDLYRGRFWRSWRKSKAGS